MRYALLIYEKPGSMDGVSEDDRRSIYAEYMALSDDPRCVGGAQLQPIADRHHRAGAERRARSTTDGPFADTKEVFGGYYVFEAGNLDEALQLAARVPGARQRVEVRAGRERE